MKTDIKIYITLGLLIASRLTMSADGASSFVTGGIPSHGSEIINKVNWPKFLERSNPVWHKLPLKWEEAPFLGNGWMGTMIFRNPDNKHELTIQAQHAGVNDHDHKSATGISTVS